MNISPLVTLLLLFASFILSGAGEAATFPDQPVRFVVGVSPGGSVDAVTRLIASKLSEMWKQPVIVDDRPGADGTIAANYVAHSAPAGTTLIMVVVAHVIPPVGYKLEYDPIRSFTPITRILYSPDVLIANPSVEANSLTQLIALAKKEPGKLNFGTTGKGTFQYLALAQLNRAAGMNIVNVTYQGSGPALVGLLGGEIQLMMPAILDAQAQIRAGKVKALAVTGDSRAPELANVQTIREAEPGRGFIEQSPWYGVLAPAGLPMDVQKKLHDDIVSVLNDPSVHDKLVSEHFRIATDSSQDFAEFLSEESKRWSSLQAALSDNSK
jgi:tripartite-type tricarboxylate transporter receptor subunit TctC